MKYLFLLLVMMGVADCRAQGFFNQGGAWIKNQLRQIALWEVYIKEVQKGYAVAKDGLDFIGEIKEGDYDLHLDHFNGLVAVNPVVAKYPKAAAIVAMQERIGRLVVKTDDAYVSSVFTHMIAGCREDLEELVRVLTPGPYALSDDERIGRIDAIYEDILEKYAFTRNFNRQVKMLAVQRATALQDLGNRRLLNRVQP